jgi:hypothetical protein
VTAGRERRPAGQGEALAVWGLWALVAAVVVVTYARVPPAELYHVSESGLTGGLSRGAVLANYPIALVAVALALVALDALPRRAVRLGAFAIALCAVVALPGVVDQDDLDARAVNAVPAAGAATALALTLAAALRAGTGVRPREPADRARFTAAAAILVVSLPWIAADLGFHLPGDLFLGEEPSEGNGAELAAVHLGHHHGLDGALLAITAIVLSRLRLARAGLGRLLALYLALMLAYGLVNGAQDFWLEQVVKRGWTDHRIPGALEPDLAPIWAVILALAALSYAFVTRPRTE